MREIVFDTETTGLSPEEGHKLLEIGAVELFNHIPTGKVYHQYINPQRDVPAEAFKVHGLGYDFLKDFPVFSEVAQDFLDFIGDDIIIAHNSSFDIGFLNYELKHSGYKTLNNDRVLDTLAIAKKLFPGAKNNLDALTRRFEITGIDRSFHGALLDSQILAKVYLELVGGAEPSFIKENKDSKIISTTFNSDNVVRSYKEPRFYELSSEETTKHLDLLEKKLKVSMW